MHGCVNMAHKHAPLMSIQLHQKMRLLRRESGYRGW
jgi:hypothetical protein